MLTLIHFDFFGPAEELEKLDEAYKKTADDTDGVEYKGRYSPTQKKYHWTYVFKAESIARIEEAFSKLDYERDYNKLTHGEVEYYVGPS